MMMMMQMMIDTSQNQGPRQLEEGLVQYFKLGFVHGLVQEESPVFGEAACGSQRAWKDVCCSVPWMSCVANQQQIKKKTRFHHFQSTAALVIGTVPGAWTFPKAKRKAEVLKWSRLMPKLIRLELVTVTDDMI